MRLCLFPTESSFLDVVQIPKNPVQVFLIKELPGWSSNDRLCSRARKPTGVRQLLCFCHGMDATALQMRLAGVSSPRLKIMLESYRVFRVHIQRFLKEALNKSSLSALLVKSG